VIVAQLESCLPETNNGEFCNTGIYSFEWFGKTFGFLSIDVSQKTKRFLLSSQSQGIDDFPVPFHVFVFDIIQKSAPSAHKNQKSSSGMMIFFMNFQMFR
jgi:hypothetical protein